MTDPNSLSWPEDLEIALNYWSSAMCAPMLPNMMKMDEIFKTVIKPP